MKKFLSALLVLSMVLSLATLPTLAVDEEASPPSNTIATYWFRNQLTDQGKKIYTALVDMYNTGKMKNGNEDYDLAEHNIVTQDSIRGYLEGDRTLFNDFAAAKDAFDLEHPEAWYMDSSYLSFRVTEDETGKLHAYMGTGRSDSYYVSGVTSASDVEAKSSQLETAINNIVSGARSKSTDAEKVQYVHEQITKSISYRFETDCKPENAGYIRTAYALVTHEGVCEGYARSFQYAMNKLGIPCVLIHGTQTSGTPEAHMWTAVYLDKPAQSDTATFSTNAGWYVVDPTWDDPVGLDKNGKIKTTGENGLDGGETETYLMVGRDVVGQNWIPSGYVSTGTKEFEYPTIELMSYKSSSLETNGLKVIAEESVMESQKSTLYKISFNGDGLKKAADKGYYFLNRMYDINADGSVDQFDWYYPAHMLHALNANDVFDPDDDFQNTVNKFYRDYDGYLMMNVSNCDYVEFAITTKAPPNWQSAEDLLTMDGYYAGDGSDILAQTGMIYNENGGYDQPPYVKNVTPDMGAPITAGETYPIHIEFNDELYHPDQNSIDSAVSGKVHDAPEAMNQKVEILFDTKTYNWGVNGRQPHELSDKSHFPENIRWTCNTHTSHNGMDDIDTTCRLTALDYEYTASKMWYDDCIEYEFYLTGLVGVKSNKFPNGWSYVFQNSYPYDTCSIASGFWWSMWGQPQLLDNPDNLDLAQMVTEGVDGKQQSLADLRNSMHLDDKDMNGRIMLSVARIGESRQKTEELADAINEKTDLDTDAILEKMLYEIDFARICRCTVVETGQSVRLCVGFPPGVDASKLEGTVFKAYHFTRDIEGSCPYGSNHEHTGEVISVEEIPIEVTAYGLVIKCYKFSPFEIVALDADKVDEPIDDTRTIIIAADIGGKIVLENGETATSDNGNIKLSPGQSVTLHIVPDDGKTIDFLAFDGHEIMAADDSTVTIAYEDLGNLAAFVTASFIDETVVEKDEAEGMTRVIADASTELSADAPSHLTYSKMLTVDASYENNSSSDGSDENTTFKTIQAAIDYINNLTDSEVSATSEDDETETDSRLKEKWTITVMPGTYDRFVVLPGMNGLTLKASGDVTVNVMNKAPGTIGSHNIDELITKTGDGGGAIVLSSNVTIDGFKFDMGNVPGIWLGSSYASAIQAANGKSDAGANGLIVRNCTFDGEGIGSGVYLGSRVNTYTISGNTFTNLDKAVTQIDTSGAPKRVVLYGNDVSDANYFYYNYFLAGDESVNHSWNGSLKIDNNTLTGTESNPMAIAVYDMSKTRELSHMTISNNNMTYVDIIQFGLDAHDAVNRVFENNNVKKQAMYAGIDEANSGNAQYDIMLETVRFSPGHWALVDDAENHPMTAKINVPDGTDFIEYVKAAIDAANKAQSPTMAIMGISAQDDDDVSSIQAVGTWVHDNITWIPGSLEVQIPEIIDPGFGVDPEQPEECPDGQHNWIHGECTICNKKCDHSDTSDYGESTEPTCTTPGSKPGKQCNICSDIIEQPEIIDATGHKNLEDIEAEVPATCTEDGKTAGQKCSDCGAVVTEQTVLPKLGHDFGEDGKCSRCDETQNTECQHEDATTVDAIDATCTAPGYTEGTWCDECGTWVEEPEEVPALGHDEATRTGKEPTCVDPGLTDGTYCTRCNETLVEQVEIQPTGKHEFEDGICKVCGISDGSSEPGSSEPGPEDPDDPQEPENKCEGDNHVGPIVSDGNGYAATCVKSGMTDSWSCKNCGQVVKAQKATDPTGEHNYVDGKCSVCGAEEDVKQPEAKCENGKHIGPIVSDNNGVKATCSASGLTASSHCQACGQTVKIQTKVPATGHFFDKNDVCTVCGAKKLDAEKPSTSRPSSSTKRPSTSGSTKSAVNSKNNNKDKDEKPGLEPGSDTVQPGDGNASAPARTMSFYDVTPGAYYYDAVQWAYERGITGGITDTMFAPGNPCTRAQVVTFLWRAFGSPEPTVQENPFYDIPESAYYYNAVLWAYEKGITSGKTAYTFNPDDTCTRAQVVTFLWRTEGQPQGNGNSFNDVPGNSYYAEAVSWAARTGITGGTTEFTFSPDNSCTRAHVVTFLYRDLA